MKNYELGPGSVQLSPSTQEAEVGGAQSSRPAWSIEIVPEQPGL